MVGYIIVGGGVLKIKAPGQSGMQLLLIVTQ
jgi:hypothetical protein